MPPSFRLALLGAETYNTITVSSVLCQGGPVMQRRDVQPPEVPVDRSSRQRLIGAPRQQSLAHGLHRVTMDDLAEGLGMSKKTIYAHFPSKATLLEAVLLDKFHCVEADLEAITSECSADFPTG